MLVLAVAQRVKQAHDRLADARQLPGADELVKHDRGLGRRREPSGREHLEAALAVLHLRDEAEVVDRARTRNRRSQPLKAILNFRGKLLESGCRRSIRATASA